MEYGTREWRRTTVSPRQARGLRRDLFRLLGDRIDKHGRVCERRLDALFLPYRSPRDVRTAYARAVSALRNCSHGFSEKRLADGARRANGMVFAPRAIEHAHGGNEAVLDAAKYTLIFDRTVTSRCLPFGEISHHAVERMFMRLATTSVDEVLQELVSGIIWMDLLGAATMLADGGRHILQVPVPIRHGILLCSREPAERRMNARTFMRHGTHKRADASIATLAGWIDALPQAPLPEAFDRIAQRPENRWWHAPHAHAQASGSESSSA